MIARELAEFHVAYRSVHAVIDVRDMQPKCRERDTEPDGMTASCEANAKTLLAGGANRSDRPTQFANSGGGHQ